MTPRTVFGMTLYNNARHLPEALDSLLAQTDPDFGLVMLDDGSSDGTEQIARAYLQRDTRLRYVRHVSRQGMVAGWRAAFEHARREFGAAPYFAWASDHDVWRPEWLARAKAELDGHPEAVLAYPRSLRIDAAGGILGKEPKTFETVGLATARERWLRFSGDAAGAGDLVYGLMRVDAMERAGVFRPVLLPDRLLMLEMTLQGEFRQVPEVLWLRRQSESSVQRQRSSLFIETNRPAGLWMPWWAQHAAVMNREYARPGTVDGITGLIVRYVVMSWLRRHSKSQGVGHRLDNAAERIAWRAKTLRRSVWTLWYEGGQSLTAWQGRLRRRLRLWVYSVLVLRRRVRAAMYEAGVQSGKSFARLRRAARRGLHHTLVLTHRLGLRGRS